MRELFYQTYIVALPIILAALMGYIVWLLKNQKKDPRVLRQIRANQKQHKGRKVQT